MGAREELNAIATGLFNYFFERLLYLLMMHQISSLTVLYTIQLTDTDSSNKNQNYVFNPPKALFFL
jgi:hypothetical protein